MSQNIMIGIQPYKTALNSFPYSVLAIQVNGEIYKIAQDSAVSINRSTKNYWFDNSNNN